MFRCNSLYEFSTEGTESLLGTGAFGNVYKGYDKETGNVVAIKTFKPQKNIREHEKTILETIVHKQVVQVIRLLGEREIPDRVIMEYCNGGSMMDYLYKPRNRYGMNETDACDFMGQFSTGLKFLIDQTVVHRDIKPHNIMRCINYDGSVTYKITDFGLSKILLHIEESMTTMVGSPAYAHPKVIEHGHYHADEVDLWSTGIMLYQLLTGNLPFSTVSLSQINNKPEKAISCIICDKQPKYATELPRDCKLSSSLTRQTFEMILSKLFNIKSPIKFDDYFVLVADLQKLILKKRPGFLYINYDIEHIEDSKWFQLKFPKLDFFITIDTFHPISHLSMECIDQRDPRNNSGKYIKEQSLCYKMIWQCQRLQLHLRNWKKVHNLFTKKDSNSEYKMTQFDLLLKMIVILKDSADNMVEMSSKEALDQLSRIEKTIQHYITLLSDNNDEIDGFAGDEVDNSVERIRIECENLYDEFTQFSNENTGDYVQRERILELRSKYLHSLERKLEDLFLEITRLKLATKTASNFPTRLTEAIVNENGVVESITEELQELYIEKIKPQSAKAKPTTPEQKPKLLPNEIEELVTLSEANQALIAEHKRLFDIMMTNYNYKG